MNRNTSYGMMHHKAVGELATTACYYAGQKSFSTDSPPPQSKMFALFLSEYVDT